VSRGAILLTGGNGLVGANLTRRLLETEPDSELIVVDRRPPEPIVGTLLGEARERVTFIEGDIDDPDAFGGLEHDRVRVVIHAAMIAHVPEWEHLRPRDYVATNVLGTANVLEWARTQTALERLIYVSTGGVYGEQSAESSESPQSEDGPLVPPELYAISKHASEQIVRRYGELFDLDVRRVRLSGVFGPLERRTVSRTIMSPVHTLLHAAVLGRPVRVTARTLTSVGDHISATDVADGLASLARAPQPAHDVYNLAHGELTTFAELVALAEQAGAPVDLQIVDDAGDAELDLDPANRRARWNAYDIARARADLAYAPRPLVEQLRSYVSWLRRYELA
jgi:nucleoside-diphosphate-sugar epimerase